MKIFFYVFTVSVNKCDESFYMQSIRSICSRCLSNKVKNMNLQVFYLISGINETRFLVHYESCEVKCELNESVCNSK